jgi:hypothetical protein
LVSGEKLRGERFMIPESCNFEKILGQVWSGGVWRGVMGAINRIGRWCGIVQ